MDIVIKIAQFILSFAILVLIHELGHFLAAKAFKVRVDKFYLFFNPYFSIWKKKIGDTVYGLGWIPLGGYCQIAGMVDESMDTEKLKQAPQPWEYRSRPGWQRLIIILAGVIFNVILAWFIYSMIVFSWGEKYLPSSSVKDGIMVLNNNLADEIGLQTGDKILEIDGKEYDNFFNTYEGVLLGNEMTVLRGNDTTTLYIPVNFIEQYNSDGGGMLFYYPRIPFVVAAIAPNSPNVDSGLAPGDRITAIGGEPITYFDQAKNILSQYADTTVVLSVQRAGENLFIGAKVNENGQLGVETLILGPKQLVDSGWFEVTEKDYGFFSSLIRGFGITGEKIAGYWAQLKKIFNPQTEAYKGLGSVITIGSLFPDQWNWRAFWEITALLSIVLAVMNLLPIPALDGGHAIIILVEMITGRKPSEKAMEMIQMVGLVIIFALMIFALGNDFFRLFTGKLG